MVDIKGYKANFLIKKNLTIPDLMNISFSRGKFIVFFYRVIAWQWWISMPGVQGFIYIRAKAMSLLMVHRESNLMFTLSSDKDQRKKIAFTFALI